MTAFVLNTNVLDLIGLKSHIEDLFINDATVTVIIKDKAGEEIGGTVWPITMDYVPASDGDYRAILPASLSFIPNKTFTAFIQAEGGGERIGHWEMPIKPLTRTGLTAPQTTF